MYQYRIFIILIIYGVLFPSSVSISDAEIVARNLYNMRKDIDSSNEFKVESIEMLNEDLNKLIYLFHLDPQGFIMVSADDRCVPVLAYSFNNPFELETIPSNVSWVVEKYKKYLLTTINSNRVATELVKSKWDKFIYGIDLARQQNNAVEPLITAEFNQDGGWNDNCPSGCESPEEAVLVGCVSVSMSQIMHYWKYPPRGTGQNSYRDPAGQGDEPSFGTLSVNFGNSEYDYDAMGDGASSSEAAAELLYDAGVSVNMDYGCESSGAQVIGGHPSAEYALNNYFQYKDDLISVYRDGFNNSEFIQILKDEIDANRPFIYAGYNDEGGHAWNCDGYDEYDLFHMNWGWGGQGNGWFAVTGLDDPDGWGDGSYVLINIEPESLNRPNLRLTSYSSNETSGDGDAVINPGETFEIVIELENLAPWAAASSMELLLTTEDAGVTIDDNTSSIISFETLEPGKTFSNASMPFIVDVDEDIALGDKTFNLMVMGVGIEGSEDNNILEYYTIEIEVNLNQFGYPINAASQKTSPLAVDFDGDGANEIIFGDYNGIIHVLNLDGSKVEDETFPFDTGAQIWGAAAGADMDGDGLMDIAVTSKSQHLYIFDKNGLKVDYYAGSWLTGTPAIGNIDDDEDLEVVVGGFSSSMRKIFAINPDGSDVSGYPLDIGERMYVGIALADFNGNGRDDIVVGTESDNLHLFYDDGSEAPGFPYQVGDKMRSAPSILDVGGQKVIFVGSNDNNLYAINSDGSLRFSILTTDDVFNSPAFLEHNNTFYVFFSDDNGVLYAVGTDGNALSGWPIDAGAAISKSVAFTDLDCDGTAEVVAVTDIGNVLVFDLEGYPYSGFPMSGFAPFFSSPMIMDMDEDGDLEILAGSGSSLMALDIKTVGSNSLYWNMYRGNTRRTGYIDNLLLGGDNSQCPELSSNKLQYLSGGYKLNSLFPNPFNPTTTISYSMLHSGSIMIRAYDVRGRLVENIISTFQSSGNHYIAWDASRYPSGIYFIIMEAGKFRETQKVLYIK